MRLDPKNLTRGQIVIFGVGFAGIVVIIAGIMASGAHPIDMGESIGLCEARAESMIDGPAKAEVVGPSDQTDTARYFTIRVKTVNSLGIPIFYEGRCVASSDGQGCIKTAIGGLKQVVE